jgi:hypothetical protein
MSWRGPVNSGRYASMKLKRLVRSAKESGAYKLKSWKKLVKLRTACIQRKMNCKVWSRSYSECRLDFSNRKISWIYQ